MLHINYSFVGLSSILLVHASTIFGYRFSQSDQMTYHHILRQVQGTASFHGTATTHDSDEVQGTDTLQGTAAYQGTASIPKSPNDYTPTDASQHIWRDRDF
ncbi:hypothetical protein Tco_0240685 [Tanacetum coccineum]